MNNKLSGGSYNFLLSNWYSGATVLSILLNNHKYITCNGETFPFHDQDTGNLKCSCGDTVNNCEFYRYTCGHFLENGEYNRDFFSSIPVISKNGLIQRFFYSFRHLHKMRDDLCVMLPGYKNKIAKFIDLHTRFFDLACEFDNSQVYLDGTKSIRRAELFARYGDKPIKIIHSIRDGRKFIASYMRNFKFTEEKIPFLVREWIDYIEMVEALKSRYPKIEVKEVRHEDLCQDKEKVIGDLCEFLGIEYDENVFKFDGAKYHMLGNDMRHDFNGVIVENNKWEKSYTKESFARVTNMLEPYLVKYNYL